MIQNHPSQSQQRNNSFDQRGWRALESRIPLFQSRYSYVDKVDRVKIFTRLISTHKRYQFILQKENVQHTVSIKGNNTRAV